MSELESSITEAERIQNILDSRPVAAKYLLTLLQKVQASFRYLPEEALRAIAVHLNIPLSRVFSVAGFYSALSLTPKGEKIVKVCCGTACHLRGAPAIIESLQKELGIGLGETSADGVYSLETVNCLGACALAPMVAVDANNAEEKFFADLTPASAKEIVAGRSGKGEPDESPR